MEYKLLENQNAIVTGARTGIGLAIMQLFAKNGCNCWAVIHRTDDEFLLTVRQLEDVYGVWVKPVIMDLADEDSVKTGIIGIIKEKKAIDILVNAAGTVSPSRHFLMTKMEDIRRVLEVNFFSAIALTQLVGKAMMKHRKGCIVNIASISAWGEDTSQMEYAASKAAIVIATKKLAKELGKIGIRVNAIAPGLIQTKMLDEFDSDTIAQMKARLSLQRLGTPEEVANVCLFLVSEQSSYITGETIKVHGG